ncbi:MAG: tetratricopeptide repeat protein [Verrucomicrobiota bacterium]
MSGHFLKSLSLAAALTAGSLTVSVATDVSPLPKTDTEWKAYFNQLETGKDAQSAFLLGTYYAAGHPVLSKGKPNHATAFRKYQEAAERGHPEAQYRLGYCYEHKLGVRRASLDTAFKWYLMAADQEVPEAQLRVGELFYQEQGAYYDKEKAYLYLSKAAERGIPDAQRMLGDCFKLGWGTLRNDVLALKWYIIAARQENAIAIGNRDKLITSMKKDEILAAEKAAKEFRAKP